MMHQAKLGTADQAWVRRMNRAFILETLRLQKTLSRARLAEETGLNPSTVSNIITELLQENLVHETDLVQAGTGRPGRLLELNPAGGCALGVEINVDYISVMMTDFSANVLWREQMSSSPEDGQTVILQRVVDLGKKAIEAGSQRNLRLLGIGVGVPGLVDIHSGMLRVAPNLHWFDVPVRDMLAGYFDSPVYVENEANAAALGEYYFGVARNVRNFIYLSAGIGLGSGIIIDGKLFRGQYGYAGEAGHMTLDKDGELCACGKRGCWETFVGPRAVERRVRQSLRAGNPSVLNEMVQGNVDAIRFSDVVTAANKKDPLALQVLIEVGQALGVGVANLVNLFNVELVVLGGAFSLASSIALPEVERVVFENALHPASEHLHIVPSAHGMDACLMGAVTLVLDEILRVPAFTDYS
jgi:glucokinase-like ROK family protein